MSRYIDADNFKSKLEKAMEKMHLIGGVKGVDVGAVIAALDMQPTADVAEVRHDFNVGDFCLYGYADGNKSLAIVEIVKILDDERGIAELKFHKVIKDNTGNGYFNYLLKSGHTMNGSFEYLKNITPIVDGERKEQ